MDQHQRQTLRRELRQRRQALSPARQTRAAAALCRLLARQPLFARSRQLALYLPNDGEIDPTPLLDIALQQHKHCYLPVLSPAADNTLWFVRYDHTTPMHTNRFGIAEPVADPARCIAAGELDLVLLPLVGFDDRGRRLGMGGGFYDRTFAFCLQQPERNPRLLGLAHQCQQVAQLDSAAWDVPLHAIVTDQALYAASGVHRQRDFAAADLR